MGFGSCEQWQRESIGTRLGVGDECGAMAGSRRSPKAEEEGVAPARHAGHRQQLGLQVRVQADHQPAGKFVAATRV